MSEFHTKEEKVKLSVIIVNWNAGKFLLGCIESILSSKIREKLEIIVVDNNSTDGSIELLKNGFSEINLIENHENKGFASANNQGIVSSKGEYALLLNPDTILYTDALSKMVNFMDENASVGACGPKIFTENGTSMPITLCPKLVRMLFRDTFAARLFPQVMVKHKEFPMTEKCVHNLSGCCLMLRRKSLLEVGFLNENLFLYFEEAELLERFQKKEWTAYYIPQAEIIHFGEKSTSILDNYDKLIIEKNSTFEFWRCRYGRFFTVLLKSLEFLLVLGSLSGLVIRIPIQNNEEAKERIKFYKKLLWLLINERSVNYKSFN